MSENKKFLKNRKVLFILVILILLLGIFFFSGIVGIFLMWMLFLALLIENIVLGIRKRKIWGFYEGGGTWEVKESKNPKLFNFLLIAYTLFSMIILTILILILLA